MSFRLVTLGGLQAFVDDDELEWLQTQRLRAALLVYLGVERTASRASVASVFWPDSDEENARHALRQNLYQLKRVLGRNWIDARAHDLRIADAIETDVGAFAAAIDSGAPETAARLYAGPFLHGIHILDLKPWESWVDAQRARLARDFRGACRSWVEDCRTRGDTAAAVDAAQYWAGPDPLDDEAQHHLILALAEAGRRTDALRQYDHYCRLLEPDDLEPLDQTRDLVARLRGARTDDEPAAAGTSLAQPAELPPPALPVPRPPSSAGVPSIDEPRLILPGSPGARRRRLVRVAVLALLLALGGSIAYALITGPPVPEGAHVLYRGVTNRTDDSQLDVVSLQLRFALGQSPRFPIVDDGTVAATLDAMLVRPEDRDSIAGDRAHELALRAGAPIIVQSDITQVGGTYRLMVEIVNVGDRPGQIVRSWRAAFPANTKDRIPAAVDSAGVWIRRTLGEAAGEIEFRIVPVARATTAKWDALVQYDSALIDMSEGRRSRGIERLHRAIEIDSAFAMAWAALGDHYDFIDMGRSVTYWERSLSLRESGRLTNGEQLHIQTMIDYDTGRPDSALGNYELWANAFPFEYRPRFGKAMALLDLGRADEASEEFARMAEDFPDFPAIAYTLARHAEAEMARGEFDGAREQLDRLTKHATDGFWKGVLGAFAGRLSFLLGDDPVARVQIQSLFEHGDAYWSSVAHSMLASIHAEAGRPDSARMWLNRGILADRRKLEVDGEEWADGPHLLNMKLLGLAYLDLNGGDMRSCVRNSRDAVALTRDPRRLAFAGTLLARCGRPDDATALLAIIPDSLDHPVFTISRKRIVGESMIARGQLDSAFVVLGQAAQLERPTAHREYFARVLELVGSDDLARSEYLRILDHPAWGFRDNDGLLLFVGLLRETRQRL